jgi:hypothetical protein
LRIQLERIRELRGLRSLKIMHLRDYDATYKEGMLAHLRWFMRQDSKDIQPVNIVLECGD